MRREDSDLYTWERRVKLQGKKIRKKKIGPPPAGKGSPNIKEKRDTKTCQETIFKIASDEKSVKPKIDRSLFSNPVGAKYKTKERKAKRVTKKVQQYIDLWNASKFLKLKEFKSKKDKELGKQTKTYQTVLKLLQKLSKGILFDGSIPNVRLPDDFSPQSLRIPPKRFQYLIKTLEKKAFDNSYLPRKKDFLAKTSLLCFLAGNGAYGIVPSLLLKEALTPAIPNTRTKSSNPKLLEVFIECFLIKTNRTDKSLTFSERNHLVGASNRYLQVFNQHRKTFEVYGYTNPINFMEDYYWQAIEDAWPGRRSKKIPLSYLNSRAIVNKILIPYFLKTGLLKETDFEGITKDYWR